MKKQFGYGVALMGVLAGAGALAAALVRRKKREEIYHEAELKAMSELDEMMGETEDPSLDCATCSCADACAAAEAAAQEQAEPEAESPDEPEEMPETVPEAAAPAEAPAAEQPETESAPGKDAPAE